VAQPIAHRATHPPADYAAFLAEVKTRIAAARTRAALAVNSELIKLYWEIGHEILERERLEGWGAKVIDRLATDLRRDFPEMTGLSRANLHHMRRFADAWPGENADAIVQQPVRQLPWGQNIALLTKLKDRDAASGTPLRLSGMSAFGLHLLMKLISLVRNDPPSSHPHLDRPSRTHVHRVREHTPGRSQPEPARNRRCRALSPPLPPRGSRRVRAAICRRRAAGGRLARARSAHDTGGYGPQPNPPIPSNLPQCRWERSTAQPRRSMRL
jgi:predicted nuclease of restriction endonuclease-like (RecB) superfamily